MTPTPIDDHFQLVEEQKAEERMRNCLQILQASARPAPAVGSQP